MTAHAMSMESFSQVCGTITIGNTLDASLVTTVLVWILSFGIAEGNFGIAENKRHKYFR